MLLVTGNTLSGYGGPAVRVIAWTGLFSCLLPTLFRPRDPTPRREEPAGAICSREATMPKSGDANAALARRVREIRSELYGEHGGPLLAEALHLPYRPG